MKRFKLGFTLSELMVALGVLGVIVAVATPAIMSSRPNKNKMLIKKSYFTTEQIVSSLINDESLYPDGREACSAANMSNCYWGFDDKSSVTYEGERYGGETKFAGLFQTKLNIRSCGEYGGKQEEVCSDSNHIVDGKCQDDYVTQEGYDYSATCVDFITTDGIRWRLSETVKKWEKGKSKPADAGKGMIAVWVEPAKHAVACDGTKPKCNYYQIEIQANGKMNINPTYKDAIEYITANSSLQ